MSDSIKKKVSIKGLLHQVVHTRGGGLVSKSIQLINSSVAIGSIVVGTGVLKNCTVTNNITLYVGRFDVITGVVNSKDVVKMRHKASVSCIDTSKVKVVLSRREATILRLRYGISPANKEHTLHEISHMYSITRERVRQIEEKALNKLRSYSVSHKLREFVNTDYNTISDTYDVAPYYK